MEGNDQEYHPDFAASDGDIVVASKEGTRFRVQSSVLSVASSFFRDTLSLPQGKDTAASASTDVIDLDEPTRVVETLLCIVYCKGINPGTAFPTLDTVTALLFAAEKYELQGVLSYLRTLIMSPRFLKFPLSVYAMSVRYGWKEEAKHCIPLTLRLDLTTAEHRKVLESLDSGALLAILDLRWTRKAALRRLLEARESAMNPYACQLCRANGDPNVWRELKWLVLDQFEKQPDGETLTKESAFWGCYAIRELLGRFRSPPNCPTQCISKGRLTREVVGLLDSFGGVP
ncbi:hypothetical protein M0805_003314 [Coniferiporia weirii]|nr:hypothetical protein M0805_003314 [Coniferiporia weirii]